MKNNIQNAIDQVGYEAVAKSIGAHIQLGNCTMHGQYVQSDIGCPLCPSANGDTASEVEHYINVKNILDPASGANPGQVINPTGISEQDIKNAKADLDRA